MKVATGPAPVAARKRGKPFDEQPTPATADKCRKTNPSPSKMPVATPYSPPPPGHAFHGDGPGQAPVVTGTERSVRRPLRTHLSIDGDSCVDLQKDAQATILEAASLRDVKRLVALAADTARRFGQAFQNKCRRLGPNRKVPVCSACSGSGADIFTLLAIMKALAPLCPQLEFEYQFCCEKVEQKRKFIRALHKVLGNEWKATKSGTPAPSAETNQAPTAPGAVAAAPGADEGVTATGANATAVREPCIFEDITH